MFFVLSVLATRSVYAGGFWMLEKNRIRNAVTILDSFDHPKPPANRLGYTFLRVLQGCCLTGAQQPGAPKKVLWAPKFLQQLPKHYLLDS